MSTSAEKKEQGAPKVGSITHAFAILRHLSTATAPEGVTTIARSLGISPSSCFNILKTLAAEEYVDFNPQTKAYTLGWAPVVLASPSSAVPLLSLLVQPTNATSPTTVSAPSMVRARRAR